MSTATLPTRSVSNLLRRTARHVAQPVNASLAEALRTATRNERLAEQAVQRIAATLRLHPRDLPLWDVTRTRNQVADVLRLAAGDAPAGRGVRQAAALLFEDTEATR